MDEGDVLTTLKILIIGESGVGKSRCEVLPYMDIYVMAQIYRQQN